jgi:hypothetical protein
MKWFKPHEFDRTSVGGQDWWPHMNPILLERLDNLRTELGSPIAISPHREALGRRMGASFSDHNFERWGDVRAADIFPTIEQTSAAAQEFVELIRRCKFSAIGCYPHWKNRQGIQQVGFHVGYRPSREDSVPALWGMIKPTQRSSQHMVALPEAFRRVGIKPGEIA